MTNKWRLDFSGSAKRVAVVGAGVSGLAAAYKLKSNGVNVMVFEADERAGGKLRSISKDGLIWDEGANTMTESEMEVKGLLDDLGIREKQQFPISQYKRYVVRNGVPFLIPTNPIALLTSNFLSAQSKFQIILEPFLWKKSDSAKVSAEDAKESVGGFFQRHFGREVVDFLIDPFVAGTSAGDPESLVVSNISDPLLPVKSHARYTGKYLITDMWAFDVETTDCMSSGFYFGLCCLLLPCASKTLTDALCKAFGKDELSLKSKVLSLSYSHDGRSALENWSLCSSNQEKQSLGLSFDAVIMTAPLCNVKEMKITKGGNLFPLDFLPEVIYMPLSVIITTFKKENVRRPLEGFGVLVPSKEQQNGLKTLGTLFSSMMFPDRVPKDLYLYTTFVGGSRNKELAKASTDELKQIVTSDLRQLLGVEGDPAFVNHFFWSKAFPLYGRDYDSVLEAIEKMETNLPGFFYAGNHRGGLSVGKSIASGCKAAELVISYLEKSSDDKMLKEGSSKFCGVVKEIYHVSIEILRSLKLDEPIEDPSPTDRSGQRNEAKMGKLQDLLKSDDERICMKCSCAAGDDQ
ncbi:protoporphyrinogen oxidase 2 [Citrus sinensis]|uniref:Protoporphyrinogen oxidase 2 n=1 Tax=Citrus sinensis TaxID=2711 RepID=A0ACB8N2E2_CITSI|nr:protoporphyrinogen oxidase 2 [Citrus sinensis]